jgi:sec-independent protein translocase protein TatA
MTPIFGEIIGWELLLVIAIGALLFGSSQLPKLARSLGSAKTEFERGLQEPEPSHGEQSATGGTTS